MDNIKLKYRSFVGQKHADISHKLIDSDIETFAIEFVEHLSKADPIINVKEHHCGNELTDKEIFYEYCLKCDEYIKED